MGTGAISQILLHSLPMSKSRADVAKLMAQSGNDRVGRPRRALFRIFESIRRFTPTAFPTTPKVAAQLGAQRKTIQRDIIFMRDELRLPVLFDDSFHGYFYEEAVSDHRIFQTTAEDLVGLFLARVALLHQAYPRNAGKNALAWTDLDHAFTHNAPETHPRDLKLFGNLAKSSHHQLVTTFNCRKMGADHAELR